MMLIRKNLLPVFIFSFLFSSAQNPGEWMWVHGDSTNGSLGNYGIQGVPSPTNVPPSLYETIEWTDMNGNFWMYGGYHAPNNYNDLWKYNPFTNEWTWMNGTQTTNDPGNYGVQGVSSPTNRPPARSWGAVSWVDLNGNFWFFGGLNQGAAAPFNDLWKYDLSTNEWTWMSGANASFQPGVYGIMGVPDPANHPGSRTEVSAGWTDAVGDLWLFGGYDWGNNGVFNDLWRYNIAGNVWTWMKGSQFTGQLGIYGTQGVEDPANSPGARFVFGKWKDSNDNFWLFGGADYTNGDYYNDLWRYNPVTNNWAWISGTNLSNSSGNYGTKCVTVASNIPAARMENRAAWLDANGNFWMFGGMQGSTLNDLWMYCPSSNMWTWESGSNNFNTPGFWGTKGVSIPQNVPSGRDGSVGWIDRQNFILYMFGGYSPIGTTKNDLWQYKIDITCGNCSVMPVALATANNHICSEECIDFTNLSANATSYQWYFSGASPDSSTDANPQNICYSGAGQFDVMLIATNSFGSDTLTLNNYITVSPQPAPPSFMQNGDTLFATQGYASYQWYFGSDTIQGATNYFYTAMQSGNYNLVVTDSNGCSVGAGIINVIAGENKFNVQSLMFNVFPNPAKDEITVYGLPFTNGELEIYNSLGEKIFSRQVTTPNLKLQTSNWSSGIYLLKISSKENMMTKKFVVEK